MTRPDREQGRGVIGSWWGHGAAAIVPVVLAALWTVPVASVSAAPEAAVTDCREAEFAPGRTPLASGVEAPVVWHSAGRKKHSDRFPDVELLTQHEKSVHFYEDLVKDRIVIVNFMYTTCRNICLPIAQNLSRVHKQLGDRMGRDILILSLSIDSHVDDPAALRRYIKRNGGEKEGWIYLTGDYDDIDRVRRSLGVYDLDPVIDADKTEHSGLITFGNDRTDSWAALPALMNSEEIVETVLRITREVPSASKNTNS